MAAAPQPGQSDSSAGILWAISAIFAVILAIWFQGKQYIVSYYYKLKLIEINLLSYFTSNLDDSRTLISLSDPNNTTVGEMFQLGTGVGYYLRIPCIIFIVMLAFLVFRNNSVRVYKRTYNMRDLLNLEKKNWPQSYPVAELDLLKMDIDKGPWAMAMTPMQFCKKNGLLEEFKQAAQENISRKDWGKIVVKLKRGLANRVFATQLGPLWQGHERLPPHVKALFAIFAARASSDPLALKLLRQLNVSATTKLDFTGVDELCRKYASTKEVKKITDTNAYVLTVMASMLRYARTDGVQASADFLWLKPLDRRLWYTLNTVGRQTPFSEVAGIFAHWTAEKEMGKRLLIPMVEEATNALELALSEIIYKPDDE
jgi:intracellular multiplication protein IcmP